MDKLQDRNIAVHTISKRGFENIGLRGFRDLPFLAKVKFVLVQIRYMIALVAVIMRERVDLVHINTMMEPFGAIAAKLCGRRVVWHVHEIFPDSIGLRLITRLIEHFADTIVVVSNSVGRQFGCADDGSPSKCRLVYNGIDPMVKFVHNGERVRNEFGISENSPIVTLIGSLWPRKGTYFFVQAAAQVLHSHPDVVFLIVGSTPHGNVYEKSIRDLVVELDLKESVIFTGQRRDVFDVLDATDILVVPSLQDPFPWVVLEGMIMGKPIVASNVGGIAEAVLDGLTGILVPVADADSIAVAVVSLLDDQEKAASMGQRGQERVLTHFSQDLYIQNMEEVYAKILGL